MPPIASHHIAAGALELLGSNGQGGVPRAGHELAALKVEWLDDELSGACRNQVVGKPPGVWRSVKGNGTTTTYSHSKVTPRFLVLGRTPFPQDPGQSLKAVVLALRNLVQH